MDLSIFSANDLKEIYAHGLTPEKVLDQIGKFKEGMTFTKILKPCTINDGITTLKNRDIEKYIKIFTDAQKSGRCMKFVPASGAASRMFKSLLGAYNEFKDEKDFRNISFHKVMDVKVLSFIKEVDKYPFYNDLRQKMKEDGKDIEVCIRYGQIKPVLEYLLFEKGLNQSNIPKGLIPFHSYSGYSRTPFEEHLVEAYSYTKDKNGKIRIHFTVSPEHEKKVKEFISTVLDIYEKEGAEYEIGYSCQKPSTDTIAVDPNNMPFREENGSLLFRPGGHGALIENLSDLNGDIIFIKNIDNVTTDQRKEQTFLYKKALGGLIVSVQKEVFRYLEALEDKADNDLIEMLFKYIREKFSLLPPSDILKSTVNEKREYLIKIFNRPIRVCGMVKNTGEPGGGPFWVEKAGKGISIQIVESSQIDLNDSGQNRIFKTSTHFNPVDLVCGVRDYKGNPFDLSRYIDKDAGFISVKSKSGRALKAMELPGLWNGAMAYWNTVFVEVPSSTFSPVKTVFDLMNDEHQSQ